MVICLHVVLIITILQYDHGPELPRIARCLESVQPHITVPASSISEMIYIFYKNLSQNIKNLFQRLLRFKAVKGFND